MKIFYIFTLALALFFFAPAAICQENKAYDYLLGMGEQYKNIKADSWSYMKAVGHGKSARKVDKRRTALLTTIRQSSGNIKRMKPFEGDNSLRMAAIEYLDLTYIVMNEDYAKIMDLEAIAEDSYDDMEAYLTAKKIAGLKISKASDKLDSIHIAFAGKHAINIIEADDKISIKLDKASETMDYYNKLYLIFFKCYKQEMYVFDALNRSDLVSLEQNRNTLLNFAEEGISEINSLGSFKGDPLLKIATLNILSFYEYEAGQPLNDITDFLILNDRIEKMSKAMQNKKKPTPQEINKYNSSLEDFNKKVNAYNKLNEQLNKKRNQTLNDWNSKGETFLAKHVPK